MQGWISVDDYLRARQIRIGAPTPGQTVGGSHTAGSLHFSGRGRDYGDANSDCAAIAQALLPLAQGPDAPVEELFYAPLNIFFDHGQAITPSASLRAGHQDHVHVGLAPGVDLMQSAPGVGSSPSGSSSGTVGFLQALMKSETAARILKVVGGMAGVIVGIGLVIAE